MECCDAALHPEEVLILIVQLPNNFLNREMTIFGKKEAQIHVKLTDRTREIIMVEVRESTEYVNSILIDMTTIVNINTSSKNHRSEHLKSLLFHTVYCKITIQYYSLSY